MSLVEARLAAVIPAPSQAPAADPVEALALRLLRPQRPPLSPLLPGATTLSLDVQAPGQWPDGPRVPVVVQRVGEGPAALLVHGWEGHTAHLHRIAEALLLAGFSVWMPDLPAHGQSGGSHLSLPLAAHTLQAVQEVSGPFAFALAHSVGGASLVQALTQGLWADRVALVATPTHYGLHVRQVAHQAGLRGEAVSRLLLQVERLSGVAPDALDMPRQARTLDQPALFIHSADDPVVPPAAARAVADIWRGAAWLQLDGLGHYRRLLEDAAVVRAVQRFAAGASAG